MDSAAIEAASDFRISKSVVKDYVVDDFFFHTITVERPYLEIDAEPQNQVYQFVVDRILENSDGWGQANIMFQDPILEEVHTSLASMCLFSALCERVVKNVRRGYHE